MSCIRRGTSEWRLTALRWLTRRGLAYCSRRVSPYATTSQHLTASSSCSYPRRRARSVHTRYVVISPRHPSTHEQFVCPYRVSRATITYNFPQAMSMMTSCGTTALRSSSAQRSRAASPSTTRRLTSTSTASCSPAQKALGRASVPARSSQYERR